METIIKVQGMTCQHCVKAVSGALSALDGVTKAQVSLEEGQVKVQFDQDKVSLKDLQNAIEDQGYDLG